jgi:hypothetical protein
LPARPGHGAHGLENQTESAHDTFREKRKNRISRKDGVFHFASLLGSFWSFLTSWVAPLVNVTFPFSPRHLLSDTSHRSQFPRVAAPLTRAGAFSTDAHWHHRGRAGVTHKCQHSLGSPVSMASWSIFPARCGVAKKQHPKLFWESQVQSILG